MTAHAAHWLAIAVFCLTLSGCAERPADALIDVASACGEVCQPLRRALDLLPSDAAPPGRPRALLAAATAPARPTPARRDHVPRPAAARRPADVPPTAVALARPPRPVVRVLAAIRPAPALAGLRTALPGSNSIVQPWFQPWSRPAI